MAPIDNEELVGSAEAAKKAEERVEEIEVEMEEYEGAKVFGEKNTPLKAPWASPGHVLVALESLLDAFGALLGRSGKLLGRSWALLGSSGTPPGRLLDATWKKVNFDQFFGLQLGSQNPTKLASKALKNVCQNKL